MFFQNLHQKLQAYFNCRLFNKIFFTFDLWAAWLIKHRISANFVTFVSLGFALLGLNFLALSQFFAAFICLILNRLSDIMDGQIARKTKITRFGAFLDIFADYTTYALFIWGFILAAPISNAQAGAFLLTTLVISVTALLALSAISGLNFRLINQSKLRVCIWGTLQNFDHFIALLLMCLLPQYFSVLAIFFGLISIGKILLIVSGAFYTLEIARKGKNKHEDC